MGISRMMRLFAGALMMVGLLAGISGATPPAARAVPQDPTEPPELCVPQRVTGAQAELVGTLRLLDTTKPPMAGQETRIIMQNLAVRLPDPACEGREVGAVGLIPRWSVVARPAGSVANPTIVGTNTAALTPDRGGVWRVQFAVCPCRVAGVPVPVQTREISFTALVVREARIGTSELESTLNILAAGTSIHISHTGNGTTAGGGPVTYTVPWRIPAYKYHDLCEVPPTPAPICEVWENANFMGTTTLHTRAPIYSSFIDFGPAAELAGAPDFLPLPIDAVEKDLSTEARVAILAAQGPGGFVLGLDLDRVRILANNLHVDLTSGGNRSWSIGGGALNLGVKMQSSHPSIECGGHFKLKTGYVVTLSEGWADELCPDFDLSQMDLSIRLIPAALNGMLTLGDAQVTALLEPQGLQATLIDFFRGVTGRAATQIETKVRAKLLEDQTKTELGKVLTAALKQRYPDLCKVVDARVIGTDLVVQYQPPLMPAFGCAGPGSVIGGGVIGNVFTP